MCIELLNILLEYQALFLLPCFMLGCQTGAAVRQIAGSPEQKAEDSPCH